jgi:hypothetical protein
MYHSDLDYSDFLNELLARGSDTGNRDPAAPGLYPYSGNNGGHSTQQTFGRSVPQWQTPPQVPDNSMLMSMQHNQPAMPPVPQHRPFQPTYPPAPGPMMPVQGTVRMVIMISMGIMY